MKKTIIATLLVLMTLPAAFALQWQAVEDIGGARAAYAGWTLDGDPKHERIANTFATPTVSDEETVRYITSTNDVERISMFLDAKNVDYSVETAGAFSLVSVQR